MPDLQWEREVFQNTGDTAPMIAAMDALWESKQRTGRSCQALLLGSGGMGKSTMMFHACKKLIRERHIWRCSPPSRRCRAQDLG